MLASFIGGLIFGIVAVVCVFIYLEYSERKGAREYKEDSEEYRNRWGE